MLKYWAEAPGTTKEKAIEIMKLLKTDSRYPQTPEMLDTISQALTDFQNKNVELISDGVENMPYDRICRTCRACFLGSEYYTP